MALLLTRPRRFGEETAFRLAEMGLPSMLAPVMKTVPSGGWPPPAGPFDALIVTSRNARPALEAARDLLSALPVLAVGERTAREVSDAGFASVTAAQGDARSLVTLAADLFPVGTRFLHAAGRHRKVEPGHTLRSLGCPVVEWECYEAVPDPKLDGNAVVAFRAGGIGAVLHYSRRSADLFVRAAFAAGVATAASRIRHFCLSEDVAVPLRDFVRGRIGIASAPHESSLLDLVRREARWTRPSERG